MNGEETPLLKVDGLSKVFLGQKSGLFGPRQKVYAVNDISFHLKKGVL